MCHACWPKHDNMRAKACREVALIVPARDGLQVASASQLTIQKGPGCSPPLVGVAVNCTLPVGGSPPDGPDTTATICARLPVVPAPASGWRVTTTAVAVCARPVSFSGACRVLW